MTLNPNDFYPEGYGPRETRQSVLSSYGQNPDQRYPTLYLLHGLNFDENQWKNLGLAIIIFLAAMQSIPEPLYEYARLEGAGFFRQAWHVTLPLIVPSSFLVFILCWINSFKIFKEVYFIGGAYPDESVYTLQNYMNNMFAKLNYQNVTTAAYIFAAIVFVIFGILFFVQKRLVKRLG